MQASGSILPYVGTVDTAMDLERIRAAIGDARLTYIGHSYGTLLGETYAEMYPTHIRAMVLDGVIDPSISMVQMVSDQAVGFENVPLLCAREIPVPGSMPRVIRVLLHYHADDEHSPTHVYLGEARSLRRDLGAAQ